MLIYYVNKTNFKITNTRVLNYIPEYVKCTYLFSFLLNFHRIKKIT